MQEIFTELSPYIPGLEAARVYAEDQYNAVPDTIKAQTRRRSQSSLMNDFVVAGLRRTLLGLPGVSTYDKYGQTIFVISLSSCAVNLKCKKVDRRLRISYIPTQMAMRFLDNPTCQSSYLNPAVNFIVGILWNDINTRIEKIYLLHPYGPNHFDWECDITQPSVAIQEPPVPVEPADSKPREKRVTPKKVRGHRVNRRRKERGVSDEPETDEPRDDNTGT